MGCETTLALQDLHDLAITQVIHINELGKLEVGNQTCSLGRERTFVIADHVDDAALALEGKRNSASQMSDNEVLVTVIQIVGFAVVDCSGSHVQVVPLTVAPDFLQTGDPDNIYHFIYGHGIIDIGLLTDAFGNLQGNCCTQIAGMVVHRPVLQNIQHRIVDLVSSALQRRKKTSAGHHAGKFFEIVSVSLDS